MTKNLEITKYADQFESGTVIYENENFYVVVEGEGNYPYLEKDEKGEEWERDADTITNDVWEKIKSSYPEVLKESEPINYYVTNYANNNKWFDMYTQSGEHLDVVFHEVKYDEKGNILESEINSFLKSYK